MNQKRPVIAIICNQDIPDNPDEAIYNDVSQRYTTAILNAGGLPVLIPDEFPPSEIQYLRDTYSGVFLIGGVMLQWNDFLEKSTLPFQRQITHGTYSKLNNKTRC
jgi:gamma-glutamyl-gamma-aminobutyrate hydrolase PuuD